MRASLSAVLLLCLQEGPPAPSLDDCVAAFLGVDAAHVSPRCDDAEFFRRLSLDLLGYPPNAEQASAFLADPSAAKREARIDELLATPRFADFWARRYAGVFFGNYHAPRFDLAGGLSIETRRRLLTKFIVWLRDQIHADRPWPEVVTEMLAARGNTESVPQLGYKASFYGLERQELQFAEGVSRHLLGINLQCARCHDHPSMNWRTEDFLGLAAFNSRLRVRRQLVQGQEQVEFHYADSGRLDLKAPLYR